MDALKLAVFLVCAVSCTTLGAAQEPARSVWEGTYTAEQARRGEDVVAKHCGYCHGDDLSGADQSAPPLKGSVFLLKWSGRTAAELLGLIEEKMPLDRPGSLSPSAYADVLSFILQANRFPAGNRPLPSDASELQRILLTDKPQR